MSCPVCGEETHRSYRPFCSRRCADIDLGKWLNEDYAIPAQPDDDTEETPTFPSDINDLKH